MSRNEERREHNRHQLEEWLLHFTERFPSGPQEILRVENRKLESKALLKASSILRMEDIPYDNSDRLLLRLIALLRLFWADQYAALDVYLNPDRSVGDLDRLKAHASRKGGKDRREALLELRLIEEAKEQLLSWLEWVYWPNAGGEVRIGHWLAVPRRERVKIITVAVSEKVRDGVRSAFLLNYQALGHLPHRRRRGEAVKLTARAESLSVQWVRHLVKDLLRDDENVA